MMTQGESAAQTKRGILLSNSAASAQQWRLETCPPSMRHKKASALRDGWKQGKRQMGGEKEKWEVKNGCGKNKSSVDIHRDRMWEINERVGCDQHTWLS